MQDQHPALTDLLLAESGDLPHARRLPIEWHLVRCAHCRGLLETQMATLSELGSTRDAKTLADEAAGVARVRARLSSSIRSNERAARESRERRSSRVAAWRWLTAAASAVALVAWFGIEHARTRWAADVLPAGTLPIAHLTPGATVDVSTEALCAGQSISPPPIADHVRAEVVRNYRMAHVPAEHYELDYLITPELGGATVAANLWPEPYEGLRWNALVKDHLERLLPRLVCAGRVELRVAQADIARDWVSAYRKYFGTVAPLREYAMTPAWNDFAALRPVGVLANGGRD